MRINSSIRYLVHLGLIILFIFTMNKLSHRFELESFSWDLDAWRYYGVKKVTGITFGVLLALEYLHHEREKNGNWKVNPTRLIILGIPALVLVVYPFFGSNVYVTLFEVMFGYILSTSLYKDE